jgi:hypothetical protein
MSSGGLIDKPFEIARRPRRPEAPQFHPPQHPRGAHLPSGPADPPSRGPDPKPSRLGHLRAAWHKHTKNEPELVYTAHATRPIAERTMRHAEVVLTQANAIAAAAERGFDAREGVIADNPKTVYLVGARGQQPVLLQLWGAVARRLGAHAGSAPAGTEAVR